MNCIGTIIKCIYSKITILTLPTLYTLLSIHCIHCAHWLNAHIHERRHARTHTHTQTHTDTHKHAHTQIHRHTHTDTHKHAHAQTHTNTRMDWASGKTHTHSKTHSHHTVPINLGLQYFIQEITMLRFRLIKAIDPFNVVHPSQLCTRDVRNGVIVPESIQDVVLRFGRSTFLRWIIAQYVKQTNPKHNEGFSII